MADTINIPVSKADGWTLVPDNGDAFITFSKTMEYLLSENQPSESLFGHHLTTFEILPFSSDTENLYVRGEGVVVLTQSSALFKGGEPRPEGLYTGTRAQTIQNYTEANCKNGVQFSAATYVTGFPAAGVGYVGIETGDKPIALKGRLFRFDGEGFRSELFEGGEFSGGTTVDIYNLSRLNPQATTLVRAFTNVTLTTLGTQITPTRTYLGSSQSGSKLTSTIAQEVEGNELWLKPNTVYIIRHTSLDTSNSQRFSTYLTWYEGEPDLPLGG